MAATDPAPAGRDDPVSGHLLAVSRGLTEPAAIESTLIEVCEGIRSATGFQAAWVHLPDPAGGALRPRVGIGADVGSEATRGGLDELLDAATTLEGCRLLGPPAAPGADWGERRLTAPLRGHGDELIGVIWAGRPRDGLIPTAAQLRVVCVFANLAAAALTAGRHDDELRFLAEHDPLTGLLNRRAFTQRLEIETARSSRYAHPLALVLCDLDGFRALNQARGHAAGDETLEQVGRALTGALRRADAAARVGGDEFALILPETTDHEAEAVIDRVAAAVSRIEGAAGQLKASFGTAMSPHDGSQPQALHQAAESALRAARAAAPDPQPDTGGG